MEGFTQSVATAAHRFGTNRKPNLNAPVADLVGNVLYSLQSGGTEPVHRGASGGVWEASSECGSADNVRGFPIVDLTANQQHIQSQRPRTYVKHTLPRQISSTICGSIRDFSMTFFISE